MDGRPGAELRSQRPTGLGRIIDEAVRLYRDNFQLFFGIVAVLYVPATMLSVYLTSDDQLQLMQLVQSGTSGDAEQDAEAVLTMFRLLETYFFGGMLVFMLVQPFVAAALIYAMDARKKGRDLGILDAYKGLVPVFWGYLSAAVMYGMAWMLGSLLLVIPGLVAAVAFSLAHEVAVLEGLPGSRALGRSYELTKGNWGRVALLALLVFVIAFVITYGLRTVIDLVLGIDMEAVEDLSVVDMALSGFVTSVLQMLMVPLWHASWLFLYYDLSESFGRGEAERIAESLVRALPAKDARQDARFPGGPLR